MSEEELTKALKEMDKKRVEELIQFSINLIRTIERYK